MESPVVREALKITSILNKHLEELNCQHGIKEIVADVLNSESNGVVELSISRSESNSQIAD
jgi:hypothetical protein